MENEIFIHEKANVEAGAKIGKGTRVWAFAHVMKNAEIGENCNIGNYAFIESGSKLGNDVTVKNGVQVYEGITAEDGVFIGPNVVFTNDRFPRSFLKRPKEEWLESTTLKKGSSLGAGSVIVCGNVIGEYAMVGAGTLVTKDVAPYSLVLGSPAKFYSWICQCGNPIQFEGEQATCSKCSSEYKKETENSISPIK